MKSSERLDPLVATYDTVAPKSMKQSPDDLPTSFQSPKLRCTSYQSIIHKIDNINIITGQLVNPFFLRRERQPLPAHVRGLVQHFSMNEMLDRFSHHGIEKKKSFNSTVSVLNSSIN